MNLEKLAGHGVVVLNVEDTLNHAIQCMWKMNARHLPVVRGGAPAGMVSERDVLHHVCSAEQHDALPQTRKHIEKLLAAARVDTVMTSPLVVLSPDDPAEEGARLMLHEHISCVPLTLGNAIVGIVTETDFLRCFTEDQWLVPGPTYRKSSIIDHMSNHVFHVDPDDATLSAIRLMRDKQIHHLPVVKDDSLVGIVSDRDVLRGGPPIEGKRPASVSALRVEHHVDVHHIMSTHVEVLGLSATLEDAACMMVKHTIGAVPIIEKDKLVGIITETDLLRSFVQACN